MPLSVVILAAGQGKRMHSELPKVLQPLGGSTLLEHVVRTAAGLGSDHIHVIYGHGGERVPATLKHLPVDWILQGEQLGTGHAVMQALPQVPDGHTLLVLYGDVPLVRTSTLKKLVGAAAHGRLAVLTARVADPAGYGRIVRDASGRVLRIVEHKDATAQERSLGEVNTGLMCAPAGLLKSWLKDVRNHNAQQEYYLTDVIALAVQSGVTVDGIAAEDEAEVSGVNDKQQLAAAESVLRTRVNAELMQRGLTLRDPARFDLRGELEFGHDVVVDVNCVFEGKVKLGDRVHVGPGALIKDCEIGADSQVLAHSVLDGAKIGARVSLGPFARIRPGTELMDEVHIGNFVEVKNSRIGRLSKAGHLAYIGDAQVGERVNIGAGVITCNYDGANKHTTVIGDDAFIGSDSTLIAPVTVGAGAYIAAGSSISEDAPAEHLSIARARQTTVENWKPPAKGKQK
jgi:bifunctional UDP-N-acetylglucosamine pyrophosphorylase / glucosamine-1-phosphate N-acetyltransferase